jgi:hypothetical protein
MTKDEPKTSEKLLQLLMVIEGKLTIIELGHDKV